MKVSIECKDKAEAAAIKVGLSDPVTRAVVVMVGLLKPLKSDKVRRSVIDIVQRELESK